MIKNERQLRITERKLGEVQDAIESAVDPNEKRSLQDFAQQLRAEIHEFMDVSTGATRTFAIESIDDLPDALVKARIAKGWAQNDLAEELGVSAQMVQKDEAGGYERAGIDRLADVADALGYELHGVFHPQSGGSSGFAVLRVETMPYAPTHLARDERSSRSTFVPHHGGIRAELTGCWLFDQPRGPEWRSVVSVAGQGAESQAGMSVRIGDARGTKGVLR